MALILSFKHLFWLEILYLSISVTNHNKEKYSWLMYHSVLNLQESFVRWKMNQSIVTKFGQN